MPQKETQGTRDHGSMFFLSFLSFLSLIIQTTFAISTATYLEQKSWPLGHFPIKITFWTTRYLEPRYLELFAISNEIVIPLNNFRPVSPTFSCDAFIQYLYPFPAMFAGFAFFLICSKTWIYSNVRYSLITVDDSLITNIGNSLWCRYIVNITRNLSKLKIAEDESDDKGPPCPTRDEVYKALDLLQNLSLLSFQGEAMQNIVLKLENMAHKDILDKKKQTCITSYFEKGF